VLGSCKKICLLFYDGKSKILRSARRLVEQSEGFVSTVCSVSLSELCRGRVRILSRTVPVLSLHLVCLAGHPARTLWPNSNPTFTYSSHKGLMHEIVSSVNCFIFFFQVGFYRAIFFSIRVSVTLLIWTCFRRGLFHNCVRQVSRQQLSCNKMVHQHMLFSQLENILTTDSLDDGLDVDLIWCGLLEVQT
jgi:hypothetical protein